MSKTWSLTLGLIIVVLGIAYYLLVHRPSEVRQQCLAEAEFTPQAIATSDDEGRAAVIDAYYQTCLHRFGLER